MKKANPLGNPRLIKAGLIVALAAGLAALGYARHWHWWIGSSTVDLAGLAQAPRGKPLRVEGDVTYVDTLHHVAVLQDDSTALAVSVPPEVTVKVGERLQLAGVLPKTYDPMAPVALSLGSPVFTVLDDSVPLPLRKISASEFLGSFEPVRLQVEGIVKSVRRQDGLTLIDVAGDGGAFTAMMTSAGSVDSSHWIDARVALRGVRFVARTPAFAWMLLMTDPRDLTIIEPPSTHPVLAQSLQSLIAEPAWTASGHRIRARGRVLRPISSSAFLLTDGVVSIPVESTGRLDVQAGAAVEVQGWPVNDQHAIVLQGATLVASGVSLTPAIERAPLTRADQIKRLRRVDADRALPVRVSGVVTGVYEPFGILFVQDATGGLYVRAPDQPLPLALGQRLTLSGVTATGEFGTLITNAMLEPGAPGPLPQAPAVTADELDNGSLDGTWVELEGKIRGATSPFPGFFTFKLRTSAGTIVDVAGTDPPRGLDPRSLDDARVRLSGVLGTALDSEGRIVGHRMGSFPLTHVEVLTPPPPDPFTVAAAPISDLLSYDRHPNSDRKHVAGTVLLQRGNDIYIEDETGGLHVQAINTAVKPGDIVDAVGYASPGTFGPVLTDAEVRKTGRSLTPRPIAVTPEQAMTGRFENRLVQIEGRVLSQIPGSRQRHLVLQSGGLSFEADVLQRSSDSPSEGSVVRLTGVCTIQSVNDTGISVVPSAFHILVPDAAQIALVRAAPRWNARNATLLFGATACGTLLVLAWVGSLRRRVRVQTHEIEEQRQFLREVIDIAPNFIFVKDREGRFTLANRAIAAIYRTTPREMIGKRIEEVSGSRADTICGDHDDEEVIRTQREKHLPEEAHIDATGIRRWVEITRRPILNSSGEAAGVLGVANDITQRKHDAERLNQARLDAEGANRAKSEFLANMSHEIRTPLNGVIGMLDLLDGAALDSEQRSMLETARSSADALLTVINDVLDFSKIDAGKLTLEHIELELAPIVEEVATLFSRQAHAKGIELSCLVHRDVPALVRGDPTRLRQVLTNLVSNAIKFTGRGEVFIGVEARRTDQHAGGEPIALVRVEIRDTGIGMSEEVVKRLFQAFTQADSSTTRRYGGTGLGLTIAKRLVDAMRGELQVVSEPGQGTTFSLTLPMPVSQQETSAVLPIGLRGLKALIVDDNATNRLILEHYLSAAGVEHVSASGAAEALAAVKTGARFDLILLDYQMPEMDGLGLLARLRADPATAGTPCVMLSSFGDRGDLPDTTSIAAWLSKPVRRAPLLRVLAGIAGRAAAARVAPQPQPGAGPIAFPGARVLLAEDNAVNQKVAVRVLGAFGVEAELALNGEEALSLRQAKRFDAILMDCQMPVMDGYEATRAVRDWERATGNAHVPIIAMTANALAEDRDRCLAAGMDDYVPKPFKRDELGAVLAKWLSPRSGASAAEREAQAAAERAGIAQ